MVNYCDQCYETVNKCARAGNNTARCQYVISNPLALRLASGSYDSQLVQATSTLSGISPQHVDALLDYTPAAPTAAPLTAEEQAVLDSESHAASYDDLDLTNLDSALSLARKRPAKYDGLRARVERLVTQSTSQVNIMKCQTVLTIMTSDYQDAMKAAASQPTTSSTIYKETTYPFYQLWHKQLKKTLQGHELAEEVDQKTLFDASTGKTYVPFEKMPKCKTPAHLFRAFSSFKEAVTVLYCLAPRAWSGMESHVYRTEASVGFLVAQQFVGEVLRRLDLKEYPNIGALMACGEHNRILDDLRPPLAPIMLDDANRSGTKKMIKFGPVTKQGEYASLIKDKDGKVLACRAFKNGEPCKAGVAAGQGQDAHVGKCAYDHPFKPS